MFRTFITALLVVAFTFAMSGCITREDRIKAQNARDGADRPMPGESAADE